MADQSHDDASTQSSSPAGPAATKTPAREPTKPKPLPPYKVLLHNDDVNAFHHVTLTICLLTPLGWEQAKQRTDEAHYKGVSLLLVTHKERAELYQEQFTSRGLTVTIEAEAE